MTWLDKLVHNILKIFNIENNVIQFFIYDVIKINILLITLVFVVSYIQSYFPAERSKKILAKFKGISANIISALLGTVTPFCSCSSIPLFIGFTGAGVPVGVTFSFLISSPMVDLASLVLLMSIFGYKVASIYVITGLIIAIAGGFLIEKLGMQKYVEEYIMQTKSISRKQQEINQQQRLIYAKNQVADTQKKSFLTSLQEFWLVHLFIMSYLKNLLSASLEIKTHLV